MPKLRVHNMTMSLDGYVAGPHQSAARPLGEGGERLHPWVFATRTGAAMLGDPDTGSTGIDDDFIAAGEKNIGATIIGRNMFGPVRGPWPDESWRGWWGENPPYHHDVFVLTHHARPSLPMDGGTTFHFVDDDPAAVLARAFDAAQGQDVRLGGGASTVQSFLQAGLIDQLHLAIAPVLLGQGERLFANLGGDAADYSLDYVVTDVVTTPAVTHVTLRRS